VRSKILVRGGKSAILDPDGQFIVGPIEEPIETIIYADIDMEQVLDARLISDYTGHYNRFDVVSLLYNPTPYKNMRLVPQVWENMGTPKSDQDEQDRKANMSSFTEK
jgi:hypothetical protein